VLILDEATSALDGITEENVFAAVEALVGAKTIIMIAHRLSTVRGCDRIFLMDRGRVAAQGTYDELLATSETFRAMARATSQSELVGA
jgi:ABC-type multidrug transport system fused ATPase/permease subunit